MSGRIGLNMNVYKRSKLVSSRETFRIRMYAQPKFKIGEVEISTNILVGDYHKKYAQEFNKFGTSVKYKPLTVHVGHHNLNLSPMTLQGHTILGGGLELNAGIFRFAGTYGRFRRDIDPTMFTDVFARASYNRWGVAGKVGLGTEDNYVDLIVLRVTDNKESLDSAKAGFTTPAENALLSIATKQRIFKLLELEGEFAVSAFTNNSREDSDDASSFSVAKTAGYLIDRNATTTYAKSITTAATFRNNSRTSESGPTSMNGIMVKAIYERIDPDYKSMGAYYLRNDLQRVRLTAQLRFLQNKLVISPQAGYENNDLDKRRSTRAKRFLGGVNASLRIQQSTFITLSYLNFNNAIESNSNDSLLLRKVTHNIQAGIVNKHELAGGKKNVLRANFSYQAGTNKSTDANAAYLGNFNVRASYALNLIEKQLDLEPAIRVNSYKQSFSTQLRISPSADLRARFMDNKMQLNYHSGVIFTSFKGTGLANTTWRNDFRWVYRFLKKQNVSVRLGYQHNFISGGGYGDVVMDVRYGITL